MKHNHLLKYFEIILVYMFLLSLTIPLSKTLGAGGWTRIYIYDFFLLPLLGFWVIRLFKNGIEVGPFNLVDIILMLFLFWLFVCNIYGTRPEKSFEAWLLFARCFLIYLYFSRNIGIIISLKSLVIMLVVLLFLEGTLALLQQETRSNIGKINNYFGVKKQVMGLWEAKRVRASGTFINPNILAGWMMALLPMTLAWCMNEKKKIFKYLLFLVCLISFSGVLASSSRSKLVAVGIGICIIWVWFRGALFPNGHKKKAKLVIVTVLFAICSGLILYSGVGTQTWNRFERLSFKNISFERKSAQRALAFKLMTASPLLGVGQNNFGISINKRDYPYNILSKELTCHNIPLKIGSESGFPGFFLFCSFFAYLVWLWTRSMRTFPVTFLDVSGGGVLTACFVIFLDMQFNTVFTHYSFMTLFFVILSIPLSINGNMVYTIGSKKKDQ
jgi:O-antigen ligase